MNELRTALAESESQRKELASRLRILQRHFGRKTQGDCVGLTVNRLLEEGRRKTLEKPEEWKKLKNAFLRAFHPDKMQMLKIAHELYTNLQDHPLFQGTK